MEALQKLRECIISDRSMEEDGSSLVFDKQYKYPKNLKTPFQSDGGHQYYTLGALWLQYKLQNESFVKYKEETQKQEVGSFVLVTDKSAVLAYLTGRDTADKYIDLNFVPESENEGEQRQAQNDETGARSSSSRAAAQDKGATTSQRRRTDAAKTDGSSSASTLPPWYPQELGEVLQKEHLFRTRDSVLQAHTGKDLRTLVFSKLDSRKRTLQNIESTAQEKRQAMIGRGGTPIIIVPSSRTSLVNLFNIRPLLQDGK